MGAVTTLLGLLVVLVTLIIVLIIVVRAPSNNWTWRTLPAGLPQMLQIALIMVLTTVLIALMKTPSG
jgi:hypothetical protein